MMGQTKPEATRKLPKPIRGFLYVIASLFFAAAALWLFGLALFLGGGDADFGSVLTGAIFITLLVGIGMLIWPTRLVYGASYTRTARPVR